MIQNEVSILRRVKHPNIVLLIEEMDVPTELYLVMELVKVGISERRNKPHAVLCDNCCVSPIGVPSLLRVHWHHGEEYRC